MRSQQKISKKKKIKPLPKKERIQKRKALKKESFKKRKSLKKKKF
ncbi:hypothetical protein N201_08445 [Helicobacter pylori UM066]|nr:hypothetical protein N201_08445 [Helicobacter pylori UM066]